MKETPRTQTGWSVLSTIKLHNIFVQHFRFVTSQWPAVSKGQLVMAVPGPVITVVPLRSSMGKPNPSIFFFQAQ